MIYREYPREHDYKIESLISTFASHAKMADDHHAKMREVFIAQNPEQEIPAHMVNPFSLAHALSIMCAEIEKLKNRCI